MPVFPGRRGMTDALDLGPGQSAVLPSVSQVDALLRDVDRLRPPPAMDPGKKQEGEGTRREGCDPQNPGVALVLAEVEKKRHGDDDQGRHSEVLVSRPARAGLKALGHFGGLRDEMGSGTIYRRRI